VNSIKIILAEITHPEYPDQRFLPLESYTGIRQLNNLSVVVCLLFFSPIWKNAALPGSRIPPPLPRPALTAHEKVERSWRHVIA
jgi:hypothetical protein